MSILNSFLSWIEASMFIIAPVIAILALCALAALLIAIIGPFVRRAICDHDWDRPIKIYWDGPSSYMGDLHVCKKCKKKVQT